MDKFIVTCRGFAGELEKLEKTHYGECLYTLSIYDSEKKATYSLGFVKPQEIKFLGGEMSFGG